MIGTRGSLVESERLLARAELVIPGWTQTLSKDPTQWVRGVAPGYLARGKAGHVWDVDGNRYVDLPMALGPVILGHGDPAVTEAIVRQLHDGIVFTLPHPLEVELAERLVARVPGVERVRFAKTGSDATSAAVRLARAATGRDGIIAGGYHGWHDWYIGATSSRLGVPSAVSELVATFAFNDLASLEEALEGQAGETAAVILEPAGAEEPASGFLEGVRERAHAAGAVLVFDEIITGFRIAAGGAQERYGVHADLVTFGKALGNGMPISAIAGGGDLMDRLPDVFFSGTHGGEALSLAAAGAVLDALDARAYDALYDKGERLRGKIEAAIREHGLEDWVSVTGCAPRTVVSVREPEPAEGKLWAKSLVQQEMLRRGVLFNGSNFMCLAHSEEDLDQVADAYRSALARLAQGLPDGVPDLVDGDPVEPAFRPVP